MTDNPAMDDTAKKNTLSVATYNIHRCIGCDERNDLYRIASVIRELNCDIVGLQEVDTAEDAVTETARLDEIAQNAGMTAVAGLRLIKHIGHYGNALLTRLPVLSVQRHDLSYMSFEPRGLLDVELQTATIPVRVMVTHLGLLPWERRYQVKKILEIVSAAPPEQTIILIGDINEWWPWGAPLRWLHRFFGCPPAVRSFPSRKPFLSLDRIWIKPAKALTSIRTHHSFVARMASDHLPVKAQISLG